ncbi:MAG: ATP-binding cassette domain-containing protein [Planctomycetia bacterium]|jgi:ATP-binding cassette subfamily F protein uup
MALLELRHVDLRYRGPVLLDSVDFRIEPGEKVCLIGRNGTGKTSLLRLIEGQEQPDDGQIIRQQGLKTTFLTQEVPSDLTGSVFEVVASGFEATGQKGQRWQIESILHQTGLEPDNRIENLSAGMKRRTLFARTLVGEPDLLLLDEPTNHLDIASVAWLEDFLIRYRGSVLFVTHDRMLLQKLATRIVDLDRGKLTSYACDYATYEKRKEASLVAEAQQNELFDKKLAQEEAWIRKGILARRTRNEGRVRALMEMRKQRSDRRDVQGRVRMKLQDADRSGRLVLEARDVSFSYDERPIIRNFSTKIMRGDRIGVIGPNGSGKSTLLRVLLDRLDEQYKKNLSGTIRHGTNLEITYFDQLQEQLDPEKTVQENVSPGAETLIIGGVKKHIFGYLQEFLFTPEQAKSPVKRLSGGEHNRLLLARLFTKSSNLLVMDEPTNDLDVETLELLEELLLNYQGTILLVSHDRAFLNNVVTSTLAFEEDGQVKEYAGGYDDWLVQREAARPKEPEPTAKPSAKKKSTPTKKAEGDGPKRLTYKEKLELESLTDKIEQMEAAIKEIHARMAQPGFYQLPGEQIAEETAQLRQAEADLAETYARWESLEARSEEN